MLGITLMLHSTSASMPDGHVTHMAILMKSNGSCVRVCACLCWDQHFPSALGMPGPTCTCSTDLGNSVSKPGSETQEGTFSPLASGTICGVFAVHHVFIVSLTGWEEP
ncbi:hypothetical protein BDV35DRAFT_399755 [Aspergillus flavus]|uniref:Uncharacterized protein n=2 Tax=Aspergillus subgen. Circumdati TaxID=2720871 RepID=A0A5N6GK57_ASPFL|nr:hypothetical protein Ao3042_01978 [Aspergillus oryzae 3.042]KAB8242741.1 hypothetical protein BDV35DRAFT_399755 [Aspergillus flavus]KDE80573.1 hypothetical protein AO1008_07420 [Aspergillus oryzae 100-8]|eukprot:EIT81559.1 hypothetical protein Ao3042_01978 [Aspergillus oryzae 3.042]